jgi:N-acetylmuramoyl-L-alanine amidase
LQERLQAIGFKVSNEPDGSYGLPTEDAVRAFQHQRGLRVDGYCGQQTWNTLVEAGQILGERLLYYRRRMLRGDDVATLQRLLGSLGFDAGRVDGIFGPLAHDALCDFQRNTGLIVDGICGPETLKSLLRLRTRANAEDVVAEVRERLRLQDAPRTLRQKRIIVGESGGLAALADSARRVLSRTGAIVATLHDPDESVQAAQANALNAEVYVGLRLDPDRSGCATSYFVGYNGVSSEGGRCLATTIQETMPGALGIPDLGAHGMRLPVLRETRMPAVLVELGPSSVVVERAAEVATAIGEALAAWVFHPCDDSRIDAGQAG